MFHSGTAMYEEDRDEKIHDVPEKDSNQQNRFTG